jgi:hypothetical protein
MPSILIGIGEIHHEGRKEREGRRQIRMLLHRSQSQERALRIDVGLSLERNESSRPARGGGRMDLKRIADYLVYRTWWSYRSGNPPWVEIPYHAFNLFEGTVWVVLSGLVLRRSLKYRHSTVEVVHALAFFTFGLTDFREAYALQSWLIWLKAANLLALLWLRALVIKRYYPESKLY